MLLLSISVQLHVEMVSSEGQSSVLIRQQVKQQLDVISRKNPPKLPPAIDQHVRLCNYKQLVL